MAVHERKIAAPISSAETQEFWAAAHENRFIIRRCTACGKAHWYPRVICPFCASEETEWVEASGQGTIYSYSVMRRVPAPYAIAYVTLAEGPTMLTNIVECDLDALKIGQKVTIVFRPTEDGPPVPMFKPA
jgi:uncharacterized protein